LRFQIEFDRYVYLQLFLHSLPEDCYFNVIGFGSSFELLFPEGSRKYDEASLSTAMTHASFLEANLGGTEMAQPLQHVFSLPPIPSYIRQIFLLTDGEVNIKQIIPLLRLRDNTKDSFSF